MVVSFLGSVRYGIISLNGENCLGQPLGIVSETSEKAWLCGKGKLRQTERELSQSFRFQMLKFETMKRMTDSDYDSQKFYFTDENE